MYTEITPRMLVGGWVSKMLFVDMLAYANVTHIVNMKCESVDEMTKKQFKVLECEDGELEGYLPSTFWCRVFDFTAKAYKVQANKIYFHVPARQHPESPVGCYAGLRAIGYGAVQARKKLEYAHPIMVWHETAMKGVELAYDFWCKNTGKNPELARQSINKRIKDAITKTSKPFGFADRVSPESNFVS